MSMNQMNNKNITNNNPLFILHQMNYLTKMGMKIKRMTNKKIKCKSIKSKKIYSCQKNKNININNSLKISLKHNKSTTKFP